eukprot:UN19699
MTQLIWSAISISEMSSSQEMISLTKLLCQR